MKPVQNTERKVSTLVSAVLLVYRRLFYLKKSFIGEGVQSCEVSRDGFLFFLNKNICDCFRTLFTTLISERQQNKMSHSQYESP